MSVQIREASPCVFTCCAISDDGSLLVTGSDAGFVDVYKMKFPE